MPITGRKPDDCFKIFHEHLSPLIAATLSRHHQIHYDSKELRRTLCFRDGANTTIPLRTKSKGTLYLYLAQSLEAVKEKEHYLLVTRQYWYGLQAKPGANEPAIIRWEYDPLKSPKGNFPCMHHLHMDSSLLEMPLNKIHVPTGWVLIEDVIRFFIVELGVKPPCGPQNWPSLLHKSAKKFFREFCPRGPRA